MALLTRVPRTADVVAETALSGLVVSAEAFDEVTADYPELAGILTDVVAERLGRGDKDGLAGKVVDRYRIRRLLVEALRGRPLFEHGTIPELLDAKRRGEITEDVLDIAGISDELVDVLEGTLAPHPAMRTCNLDDLSRWTAPLPLPGRSS